MSLVCVPILVQDKESALSEASEARRLGADLIEFRFDEFLEVSSDQARMNQAVAIVTDSTLPCIATCRTANEGGHYTGTEEDRLELFERLCDAGIKGTLPPRFVDIEHSALIRSTEFRRRILAAIGADPEHGTKRGELAPSLILSMHDFSGRPSDLIRRLEKMNSIDSASIIKIAYRARSLRDSLEILDLASTSHKPIIALGMGEFGFMTRVLAPKFGGFLTFASLRSTAATAPGQPMLHELLGNSSAVHPVNDEPKANYRFRSIKRSTKVYGVIGWPVGHSLSPLLHNAGFGAVSYDGVYLPLPVYGGENADDSYASFKATLNELVDHPRLDFHGCSVTSPHKRNLVRLAREQGWELDADSDLIGAANTLVINRAESGTVSAKVLNTDIGAATEWIRSSMSTLSDKTILLLGAGGVAASIAAGAARSGAHVVIRNRSAARARLLADDLNVRLRASGAPPITTTDSIHPADCIINCTSLGMLGGAGEGQSLLSEQDWSTVRRDSIALESVYTPRITPFLRAAGRACLTAIGGAGFFVRQAEAQFEAWTGFPPPNGLYERLVCGSLNESTKV